MYVFGWSIHWNKQIHDDRIDTYRLIHVSINSVPIVTVSSHPYKNPVGISGRKQCHLFSLLRTSGSWTTNMWSRCRRCGRISEHFRVLAAPISPYTWARAGALIPRSRCCCPPLKYYLKYRVLYLYWILLQASWEYLVELHRHTERRTYSCK